VEVAEGGIDRGVPEEEVRVAELKAFKTKSGNTRYVLVDDQGKEYSTFKEAIAAKLPGLEGKRVRITYHEQRREGFTNVYLDDVEPLEPADPAGERETDEVAWKTAIEAAPYLLDAEEAEREISPRDLFAKLQPFKELVAEDIEQNGDG
jgi:hypothetical protein